MLFALIPAHTADATTGLKVHPCNGAIERTLAREHPPGRQAYVGAIKAEPDTTNHLSQVLLTKVGVSIGDAGLGAVEARLDARHQCILLEWRLAGVGPRQWCGIAHGYSFLF